MEEEGRKRKLHALEDAGSVFEKIRENANNLLEAKRKRTESPYSVVTEGALLFQKLREDHRDVCEEVEDTKAKAQKAKPKLDQLNLQLQNLLYERNYYLKEIQRCREFKPKNEVVDLIEVERFLEKAPPEWSTEPLPDAPPSMHHQFMLQRLRFELQERKRLGKELEEIRAEKTRSQLQQQTKQELLNNIQSNLSSLYQAALPLQQYFGAPTLRRSNLMNEAQHLSVPLYTLFSRLHAYKEATGDDFEVSILGDTSQAIQGYKQEVDDTMPLTPAKAKHGSISSAMPKKKTTQITQSEETYKSHPLELLLRFTGSEDGVRFSFLPTLKLVTVTGEGGLSGALTSLFPNDTGIQSPNPTNKYLFTGEEFSFSKTHPSRPYRWAQDICGLQFLPSEPTNAAPLLLPDVFTQLKSRLKARRSLRTQLDLLAKNSIAVSSSQRISTQLVSWAEIKPSMYHEFVTQDRPSKMNSEDIPCRYYCAMFRRVDAVLDVRIALRSDYPICPPEFRLKMVTGIDEAKGEQIKALETQINTEKADQGENMILSIQLHKVQTAFEDIMERK